jgi:hypothetical protein
MLELRQRIFVGAGIVIALLVAIVLLFLVFTKKQSTPTEDLLTNPVTEDMPIDTVGTPREVRETPPAVSQEPVAPAEDAEQRFVRQLARTFVERFGSYSNQNDNRHIDDARALSTPSMQAWIDNQTVEQRGAYTGSTMVVIEHQVILFTETAATVSIGLQQQVVTNGKEERLYKTGNVTLVKQNGTWLVDGLYFD